MSFSDAFETSLLQLLFQNANIANLGDATGVQGSAAPGSLYIALHTADPGEPGNQSTNETTYAGYARTPVNRAAGAWTVAANQASNVSPVVFPQCIGGAATLTHFSIGFAVSGAGVILMSGPLTASLAISAGITPIFAAGALAGLVD